MIRIETILTKKKHFSNYAATQNWMPTVIILHFFKVTLLLLIGCMQSYMIGLILIPILHQFDKELVHLPLADYLITSFYIFVEIFWLKEPKSYAMNNVIQACRVSRFTPIPCPCVSRCMQPILGSPNFIDTVFPSMVFTPHGPADRMTSGMSYLSSSNYPLL